jgi:PspA-Associated protein
MSEQDVIVRVSGYGQFKVKKNTMGSIDTIDNAIVDIIENGSDDNSTREKKLRGKLKEIVNLVTSEGKALDHKEIVQSNFIIPSPDFSVEEAKKIFKGEGLIPDL